MSEDVKKEIKQLMVLISSLRSLDNERYEEHVKFSNEVISFINKIAENMDKNWEKIHQSLLKLNDTVEKSLDAMLTGVNPEGIRETSASLKEIMNTMGKSLQSMNLENVMQELRSISEGGVRVASSKKVEKGESISLGGRFGAQEPAAMDSTGEQQAEPEIYGYVPGKKKKDKKESEHLIKPSQLFGSGDTNPQ